MGECGSVVAFIPARLAATRLPDKPLIDICGKPMIQWVWERASMAHGITRVAICTPDAAIAEAAAGFGAETVMTSPAHRSGTDRLAEAADNTPPCRYGYCGERSGRRAIARPQRHREGYIAASERPGAAHVQPIVPVPGRRPRQSRLRKSGLRAERRCALLLPM